MTITKVFLFLCVLVVLGKASTIDEFARANRNFSAFLYQKIGMFSTTKNILVSPLSTEILLALAQTGAKGETAKEIQQTLNLPNSNSEISRIIKTVLEKLKSNEHYTLHSANKAYITQKFPVKQEFKQIAEEAYQANFENIDFSDSVRAADTINKWVENQTRNTIKDLMAPETLDQYTVSILVNTLYFEAFWYENFDIALTKKIKFYTGPRSTVEVDAMHLADSFETFKYSENIKLGVKFVEFPFTDTRTSMVVALPNRMNGIRFLESDIEKVLAPQNYTNEFVKIALPKFRIENLINLKPILQELGIKKAFDSVQADFSAMAGDRGQVYVSDIVQKTFVDVNEEGVKAGAATYAKSYFLSIPPKPSKEFIVNCPFLFYIKVEDIILFVGKVVDPTE